MITKRGKSVKLSEIVTNTGELLTLEGNRKRAVKYQRLPGKAGGLARTFVMHWSANITEVPSEKIKIDYHNITASRRPVEQTSFKKHHKFVKQRGSRWDSSLYLLHISSYACTEAFIIFCVTHCSSPSNGLPKSYVGIIFFSNTSAFPKHTFVFTHNVLSFLLGTTKCIARESGSCWKDRRAPYSPSSKSLTSLSFPFSLSQTLSVF